MNWERNKTISLGRFVRFFSRIFARRIAWFLNIGFLLFIRNNRGISIYDLCIRSEKKIVSMK